MLSESEKGVNEKVFSEKHAIKVDRSRGVTNYAREEDRRQEYPNSVLLPLSRFPTSIFSSEGKARAGKQSSQNVP